MVLLDAASIDFRIDSPKSSPKLANSAPPHNGQRLAVEVVYSYKARMPLPRRQSANGYGRLRRQTGSLKASGVKTRNGILHEFRAKAGFDVLILSPFVAGIGLTIVESNHVVHYGRWWNPAVESQATDRAYRIGQTKDVSAYLPILRDPSGRVAPSFDERLDVLMNRKQRLAEDFLRPLPPEDEMGGELLSDLRAEASLRI